MRHRRSDRHRAAEEIENQQAFQAPQSAQTPRAVVQPPQVQPSQEDIDEIRWQRRQPSNWPEENAPEPAPAPRRRASRANAADQDDQMFMRRPVALEDAMDEEDEGRSIPWLKIIVGAFIVVLLLAVALHFMDNAGPLTPLKNAVDGLLNVQSNEPGKAYDFQAAATTASTNSRLILTLTTNQNVDGVRIEDEEGNDIACTVTLVNGEKETNKIWNISAIFDMPYTGNIYAVIREKNTWTRTDKMISLSIADPTPAPTEEPLPTQKPFVTVAPVILPEETVAPISEVLATAEPESIESMSTSLAAVVTWAPTNAPLPTEGPAATEAPTEAPTPAPTEEPTPRPTAPATALPTASPLPRLEAYDGAGSLKSTENVVKDKSVKRESGYIAPHPDNYMHYPLGVATFRGDNFRRNAAFGTADIQTGTMSVKWQSPIGSLRTDDYGTLYGVGWTGQPAIIRWTQQVREGMSLYEDKVNVVRLTEVIFAAQDGKIYFLDLSDGSPTRDPINVGFPLKGSVSIDRMDRPLLAVGQGISKLANGKTGSIGLRLFNLVNNKEIYLLNGRKHDNQTQYTSNGAFDGTALFLYDMHLMGNTDALVVAGENGLLYAVDLNGEFNYPTLDNPDAKLSIDIKPAITYLRTKASAEKDAQVGVESSIAMYDKYIYMADTYGVIRCVDSDTLKSVWAIDAGDNTDAALALDMDSETSVSLYTGNTCYNRLGSKNPVTIRRINALTGEEIWKYEIKCTFDKNQMSGCKASPVIGQNAISNLVIFTVNMVDGGGSKIIALDKQTGSVVWEHALASEAISSPVAVYNDRGEAWIVQGDEGGNLTMLYGRTGEVRSTLNLGGAIEGSPAVYNDMLVVGTCSKNNANMYCVELH